MRRFRPIHAPLGALALAAAISVPAFAQVEEEIASGPKSREQVVAELEQAKADGALARINSEAGYSPDFDEAKGLPVRYSNTQGDVDVSVSMDTSRDLTFAPPAAGGKSRAQVMDELAQAQADGSLQKMWSDSGYAPEFETARSSRY
ncbi:DUF4148 domain-containing protein [Roseateles depolymerans]|uniref:Uncharacterized protein n=1 Tax=Roseateles depolymerans TaxID=76731 RepID=A0A0U2U524_9BURK|nr:DUF4148 domain-containing protein [Roseateles depolymerans]ALV07153.1 hypothetical protein RD2015_2688 [Roseateles depolymerans]REG20136.1 uncharacterized protein DUF4148 [Roseateles depolymerans]